MKLSGGRDQRGGVSRGVVGAQHPHHRCGSAGEQGQASESIDAACEPIFSSPAGQMDMAIDQSGDNPLAHQICDNGAERCGKIRQFGSHPDQTVSGHQQVLNPTWCRCINLAICQQLEHGLRISPRP